MTLIAGFARDQLLLLLEAVDDYVDVDIRFASSTPSLAGWTLRRRGLRASTRSEGRPGYTPGDLLKLYIYGYVNRVRSSRRLERECRCIVEVIWLLGALKPDFKTIADFRRDNRAAFRAIFPQFVLLCRRLALSSMLRVFWPPKKWSMVVPLLPAVIVIARISKPGAYKARSVPKAGSSSGRYHAQDSPKRSHGEADSDRRSGRVRLRITPWRSPCRKSGVLTDWRTIEFADGFADVLSVLFRADSATTPLGVRFVSVQDQIVTDSPMARAMFTIIGAMAELESSLISERVTAGMRAAEAHISRAQTES